MYNLRLRFDYRLFYYFANPSSLVSRRFPFMESFVFFEVLQLTDDFLHLVY